MCHIQKILSLSYGKSAAGRDKMYKHETENQNIVHTLGYPGQPEVACGVQDNKIAI
jgi:hypothetical protein